MGPGECDPKPTLRAGPRGPHPPTPHPRGRGVALSKWGLPKPSRYQGTCVWQRLDGGGRCENEGPGATLAVLGKVDGSRLRPPPSVSQRAGPRQPRLAAEWGSGWWTAADFCASRQALDLSHCTGWSSEATLPTPRGSLLALVGGDVPTTGSGSSIDNLSSEGATWAVRIRDGAAHSVPVSPRNEMFRGDPIHIPLAPSGFQPVG